MKEGRASLTAVAVAVARGLARAPDRTAPEVLPPVVAGPLRRWQALPSWARRLRLLPRLASGGLVDHLDLRTATIDAALTDAVEHGARTLVLLGAGFDGRAYRMSGLRGVDVFEVDHPATATAKQAAAEGLPLHARSLRSVQVDFDRMSVAEALQAEGHDATQPTVWIWEGVTPYLPRAAIEQTLDAIADRSAPKSRLLMTYAVPQLVGRPRLDAVVRSGFAWLGEPLRGEMTPAEAADLLSKRAFDPLSDSGQNDWAGPRRLAYHLAWPLRAERLLLAEKRGQPPPPRPHK